MLNFGLTEMRIVAPRDGWPNPAALPPAAGADMVLDQAQLFEDVPAAVADCGHVFATTVRKRGIVKPVLTAEQAAQQICMAGTRTAILFGPERSGLDSEDVALARSIVTVPVNPAFASLNLAQAVILMAYEYSRAAGAFDPDFAALPTARAAPQDRLDQLIEHLFGSLSSTNYFYPPDRTPTTKRNLRSILTKPGWTEIEIQALRGVISALTSDR